MFNRNADPLSRERRESGLMSARIIDGKALAAELRATVAAETQRLLAAHGLQPGLAVVLIGDNPASKSYVGSKSRALIEAGMRPFDFKFPASASEAELLRLIKRLNADSAVNGILVQLPLPPQINTSRIIASIDPDKDVDGFHPLNAGRLMSGLPALVPCTPVACLKLIKTVHKSLVGIDALMVGRSHIVGNPLSQVLLNENATVTVAHTSTRHLPELCRRAELLCVAIGCAEFIRGDWIKPGATVIDVGINRVTVDGKSRIVGDVNFAEAVEVAGAITPVPGGVGPMTIVSLLVNTLRAACMQAGLPPPAV
jgi:methylenetetrahydrofolate dehydrogenase (NADP+) / methenyltetrahydrofolate cyclohydrolase